MATEDTGNSTISERLDSFKKGSEILTVRPPFPKCISIDTTNACNYRCVFCPKSKLPLMNKVMDIDLFKRIVKEAYDLGSREIGLSIYSEPLMNKNLEEYVRFSKETGFQYIYFTSNGSLLTPERSKSLLSAGLDSIRVSINSTKKNYALIHGVKSDDYYDRVINNVKQFDMLRKTMKSSCRLYVSMTLINQTNDVVEAIQNELKDNVDDFVYYGANNRGGIISESEKLFMNQGKFAFGYPCYSLFNKIDISCEGYVVTCCQDFENLTAMADLNKMPIGDAWVCDNYVNYRQKHLDRNLEGTLCKNCYSGKYEKIIPITPGAIYGRYDSKRLEDLVERVKLLDSQNNH